MKNYLTGRRDFLRSMSVLGAAATIAPALRPRFVHAADAPAYDPNAHFDLEITEVVYRRRKARAPLMARIYQPVGEGPFPTVLDLHGGGWNHKDRYAEEPINRAMAASGLLVVAIDLTVAAESHYPANVQDANYGVRWLKSKAATWNGDASRLGVFGSSSGGHVAQLIGMRPHYPLYNTIPLPEAPEIDATVSFVASRSPISDTFERYENAVRRGAERMVSFNKLYFIPWDTIHEANPQEILDRGEEVTLVPMLIMQGALDNNVLPWVTEKFAETYNAAGGNCDYQLFENSVHQWTAEEGPQTDRARQMVKEFIARQLSS